MSHATTTQQNGGQTFWARAFARAFAYVWVHVQALRNINSRKKFLAIVFITYGYSEFRAYYKQRYAYERDKFDPVKLLAEQRAQQQQRQRQQQQQQQQDEISAADTRVPQALPIFRLYQFLSTALNIYASVHSIVLILMFDNKLFDVKWNCYIPGRICLTPTLIKLSPYFELLLTYVRLGGMIASTYYERTYKLDFGIFLILDSSKLARFFANHIVDNEEYAPRCKRCKHDDDAKSDTKIDKCLDDIMFMDVCANGSHAASMRYSKSKRIKMLRPNRHLSSHARLKLLLNSSVSSTWKITLVVLVLTWPVILATGLFDAYYVLNYPTCSPELERGLRDGTRVWYGVSIWPPNHRFVMGASDIVLNWSTYIDGLGALLVFVMLAFLIAEDLLIYWQDVRARLDRILAQMRADRLRAQRTRTTTTTTSGHNAFWSGAARWRHLDSAKQDREIELVQAQIRDFFRLLHDYDHYVSFVITLLLFLWVFMFTVTSYIVLRTQERDSGESSLLMRQLQLYAVLVLSTPVYNLIRVRHALRDAYIVMCAIMAHDQQCERKLVWSRLLELYTHKRRFGFTLAHQPALPLTWSNYLKLIVTTIAGYFVFETYRPYFRQQQ